MKEQLNKWIPPKMQRPMLIMLVILGILFGGIFAFKLFSKFMMKRFFASMENPTYTVSTTRAVYKYWRPDIKSVGSTRATLGVNITAQLGGMIQHIYFTPGAIVNKGTLLVQQNADPNIGQLHSLQANAELARITYYRDQKQFRARGISKQQLDQDLQNWKSYQAQVEQQQAIVNQLTITAPFTGRLGISKVNPGQYLNPGDTVVTLQSLDPIYVDFYLPQNLLANVAVGQVVDVVIDAYKDKKFTGKITTINPVVETGTRNVEVEATLPNPDNLILPGMFATVTVNRDVKQKFITIPKAAVTYNPYGDLVYFVTKVGESKDGKPVYNAKQKFVTIGDTRGDQVAITSGLNAGEVIVTSGQLKLKNNSLVAINNAIQPSDSEHVTVNNEHTGN